MVVFKMRDSVPSASYSSVCNVLRLWRIWLIPTYESTDSDIREGTWKLQLTIRKAIRSCDGNTEIK